MYLCLYIFKIMNFNNVLHVFFSSLPTQQCYTLAIVIDGIITFSYCVLICKDLNGQCYTLNKFYYISSCSRAKCPFIVVREEAYEYLN